MSRVLRKIRAGEGEFELSTWRIEGFAGVSKKGEKAGEEGEPSVEVQDKVG